MQIKKNYLPPSKYKYWKLHLTSFGDDGVCIELRGMNNCKYFGWVVDEYSDTSIPLTYRGKSRQEVLDQENQLLKNFVNHLKARMKNNTLRIEKSLNNYTRTKYTHTKDNERLSKFLNIPELKCVVREDKLKRINK